VGTGTFNTTTVRLLLRAKESARQWMGRKEPEGALGHEGSGGKSAAEHHKQWPNIYHHHKRLTPEPRKWEWGGPGEDRKRTVGHRRRCGKVLNESKKKGQLHLKKKQVLTEGIGVAKLTKVHTHQKGTDSQKDYNRKGGHRLGLSREKVELRLGERLEQGRNQELSREGKGGLSKRKKGPPADGMSITGLGGPD